MLKFICKRLLTMIPMLLGITIVSYFIMNLAPGDAADMFIDPETMNTNSEYVEMVREKLGLKQPVHIRYFNWLRELLRGNFGYSYLSKQPVWSEIKARIGPTILLASITIVIQMVLGVTIGVFCAKNQYKPSDYIMSTLSLIGMSMPSFWFAMMLILVFSTAWRWLPSVGLITVGLHGPWYVMLWDRVKHLIMPVIALSLSGIGSKVRYQRSSYLEVMNQDYIRTARSKGLSESTITWTHAFRNSCIPIVTMLGGTLPALIGGSFVIESVFGLPGLGRYGTQAVMSRDYPVMMATILVSSALVMIGILISDLLYALIDPRISY